MNDANFERLVLANEGKLFRISMSMLKNEADAQDAVHDTILKAYQKLHTLKKEEYFTTWLVRILINNCNKQLRMRKRADSGFTLENIDSRDYPYINIEIGEALNSLPVKIRTVVVLYYVEGYTIKEIKDILHIPEGTVKSRLNKARKSMINYLI